MVCFCMPGVQEGGGLVLLPVLLSAEEGRELQLQQAYLTYLWGRAAVLGVEPQASTQHQQLLTAAAPRPPQKIQLELLTYAACVASCVASSVQHQGRLN